MKKISKKVFAVAIVVVVFAVVVNLINHEKSVPLYQVFEVDQETYSSFEKIFSDCGFTKITSVTKEDSLINGTKSFYVEMEDVEPNKVVSPGVTEGNLIYVYVDSQNNLEEISVNFNPIYKNGEVLNQLRAFTKLTTEEKTECQLICETLVPSILKNPSTAQFCKYKEYQWAKESGIIKAKGFVDSMNGLGIMARSEFILTYNCVNKKIESLTFEGKQVKL